MEGDAEAADDEVDAEPADVDAPEPGPAEVEEDAVAIEDNGPLDPEEPAEVPDDDAAPGLAALEPVPDPGELPPVDELSHPGPTPATAIHVLVEIKSHPLD